jgi:hypothetical protein
MDLKPGGEHAAPVFGAGSRRDRHGKTLAATIRG